MKMVIVMVIIMVMTIMNDNNHDHDDDDKPFPKKQFPAKSNSIPRMISLFFPVKSQRTTWRRRRFCDAQINLYIEQQKMHHNYFVTLQ